MVWECQGFRFIKDNKVYDPRYDKEVYNPIDSTVSDIEWQGFCSKIWQDLGS